MHSPAASCAICGSGSRPGTKLRTSVFGAAWYEDVERWIDTALEHHGIRRTAGVQEYRTAPWAFVAVVPTATSLLYFKAPAPRLTFEAALTHALAQLQPSVLPEVLAHDAERGWLLMRDAGAPIADGRLRDPADYDDVLRAHARLQIATLPNCREFLAAGAPDQSPRHLAGALTELLARPESHRVGTKYALTFDEHDRLHEAVEFVAGRVQSLPSSVPVAIAHEEIVGHNVFVRDGQLRIIDWAEAAVAHPFGSLIGPLRYAAMTFGLEPGGSELRRLRDVYLSEWSDFGTHDELVDVFTQVYPLGAVCRLLTWDRSVTSPLIEDEQDLIGGVTRWWRVLLALAEGEARLGA